MTVRWLAILVSLVSLCSCSPSKPEAVEVSKGEKPTGVVTPVEKLSLTELDSIVRGKSHSDSDIVVAMWPWVFGEDPPFKELQEAGLVVKSAPVRNPGVLVATIRNEEGSDFTSDQKTLIQDFIKRTKGSEPISEIKLALGPDGKTPMWMGTKIVPVNRQNWVPPVQHKIGFPTVDAAKKASHYFSDKDYEKTMGWGGTDRRAYLGLTIKNPKVAPEDDAEGLAAFAATLGGEYVGSLGNVKKTKTQ